MAQSNARYRSLAYALGLLLGLGVIAWAEYEIWHWVNHLRQQTEAVSSDNYHLSNQLEARIRELDDNVFRYSLDATPDRRAAIDREAETLRQWIAVGRQSPVSAGQADALGRAETLYARYVAHVGILLRDQAGRPTTPVWRQETELLLTQMLELTQELNRAEKAALSELMSETRLSLNTLYGKLIVSSFLLLSTGAVMAYLVYRGIIAPLRSRLRQSQRIIERQEKLSSLGVLAAGVAHEIRNPLTSIKARLFTQQSLLEQNSEAWEDNTFITEEISRLEKIVADFLAFARPSEPKMVAVDAAQLLRDLEALFRPALSKAAIQLKLDLTAHPIIDADPAQVKQVLINLVQNAAESIGRDGQIHLRLRTQKRSGVGSSSPVAVLDVEDTGKGVPPDLQRRLFDPFFTTKANGTGLGLSMAARILEKHRGTLEYQPGPNRGAIFRLVIPLAENHS